MSARVAQEPLFNHTGVSQMAWSHSALKEFETCNRRYHEAKILKKHPFEETKDTLYGKEIHKVAEDYVKKGTHIPSKHAFLKPIIDALIARPGKQYTEYKMALTNKLEQVEWWDKAVWVRGMADLLIVDEEKEAAWVIDYKTGSAKYPDTDQLDLMALQVMACFPKVKRVKSALVFVTHDRFIPTTVHADQVKRLWEVYRERVAKIDAAMASNVWNPTQSGLCKKYCPVLSCEFNGRG